MKKIFILLLLAFVGDYHSPMVSHPLDNIDLNKTHLKVILEKKEINVSVSYDNEPLYIENAKPNYPGFEVELAQLFADYLGVKLNKIIPKNTFEDHLRAIEKGEVDISMGNSANIDRGKYASFSAPYILTSPAGLISKSVLPPQPEGEIISNNPFKSLKDLLYQSGLSISVKAYTYNYEVAKEMFGNKFPIYTYMNDTLALNALLKNRVNCYITDDMFVEGLLQKYPYLSSTYRPLTAPIITKEVSIMIKKYDILLLEEINFFVRQLKRSGDVDKLRQKYYRSNEWVVK